MSIRDELMALQRAGGGVLKAEAAVQWARGNPASELHRALQWDNEKAADEFRLFQVRRLIAIHVVHETGVRQMVSLVVDRVNRQGGGYRHIDDVLAAPSLRQMLFEEALADLNRVREKYEGLEQFARVWDSIRAANRRAQGRKRRQSTAKHIKARSGKAKQRRRSAA